MAEYQERVIVEKKELDERLEKLNIFLAGEGFLTLPKDEQFRLSLQAICMQGYSLILGARIEAFN
jgi:hypothetical protein